MAMNTGSEPSQDSRVRYPKSAVENKLVLSVTSAIDGAHSTLAAVRSSRGDLPGSQLSAAIVEGQVADSKTRRNHLELLTLDLDEEVVDVFVELQPEILLPL